MPQAIENHHSRIKEDEIQMTPESQRIAIATACGIYRPTGDTCYGPRWYEVWINSIPDFCNDLNAMHEAEKALSDDQRREYVVILCRMFDLGFKSITATAAQRAEAFLRTLNLWKKDAQARDGIQSTKSCEASQSSMREKPNTPTNTL